MSESEGQISNIISFTQVGIAQHNTIQHPKRSNLDNGFPLVINEQKNPEKPDLRTLCILAEDSAFKKLSVICGMYC